MQKLPAARLTARSATYTVCVFSLRQVEFNDALGMAGGL